MNFCSDSISGKYISNIFSQYVIVNQMNKKAKLYLGVSARPRKCRLGMQNFNEKHPQVIKNVRCRCKICERSILKSQKKQDVDAIIHARQTEKHLQVQRRASCRYFLACLACIIASTSCLFWDLKILPSQIFHLHPTFSITCGCFSLKFCILNLLFLCLADALQ